MNFGLHLGNAFNSLKRAPLLLIMGSVAVSALTVISLGLLAGPLYGSYQAMMIRLQRDNRLPEVRDLGQGFGRFRQLFPLVFMGFVILLGLTFYILPGLILATLWLYTLPLMADRDLTLFPALKQSAMMVKEKGFLIHLLFLLLITVIPAMMLNVLAGIIPLLEPLLLLLLFLFLPPLQQGCLASLYLANFPRETRDGNAAASPDLSQVPVSPFDPPKG